MRSIIRRLKLLLSLLILLLALLLFLQLYFAKPSASQSESGAYEIYFCPAEDCRSALLSALNRSTKIECAFYDLGDPALIALLKAKNADVLVFEENDERYGTVITNPRSGLMHDKFCILDDMTVVTGSLNPTVAGITKNDNNLFIIAGDKLAQNYAAEFQELKDRTKGTNEELAVQFPVITHTVTSFSTASDSTNSITNSTNSIINSTFIIENYFCPEDDCQGHLLAALSAANSSIEFMTYSFTDDKIGDLLVQKRAQGVTVTGVFEKQQESKYSEYTGLKATGCDVRLDGNPSLMHHKVFIIDRTIVAFGSYNPSANGNTKNDENMLIVHDAAIAEEFGKEFERVLANASQ